MRVARFTIGDRSFDVPLSEVGGVMAAVVTARGRGEWVEFVDARGSLIRLIIPRRTLLLIQEQEVGEVDQERAAAQPDEWPGFDFD
jgi:hypothetical protein